MCALERRTLTAEQEGDSLRFYTHTHIHTHTNTHTHIQTLKSDKYTVNLQTHTHNTRTHIPSELKMLVLRLVSEETRVLHAPEYPKYTQIYTTFVYIVYVYVYI